MKRRLDRMSDSTRAKAQRSVNTRMSLPHMSQSAFVAVMKFAQHNNVDDMPSSRAAYSLAMESCFEDTPYGPLIVTVPLISKPPNANREMVVVNPFAYLHVAFKKPGGFFDMFSEKLKACPSTHDAPWRLVLYADEVVPGNQMSVNNTRKFLGHVFPHSGNRSAFV